MFARNRETFFVLWKIVSYIFQVCCETWLSSKHQEQNNLRFITQSFQSEFLQNMLFTDFEFHELENSVGTNFLTFKFSSYPRANQLKCCWFICSSKNCHLIYWITISSCSRHSESLKLKYVTLEIHITTNFKL